MSLAISIINYKTFELTRDCLNSILNQKSSLKPNIYVVDNASNDGSLEKLRSEFPGVKFIASQENLGFAGGHNLALKKIEDELILLLNSDAKMSPGSLEKMVEYMETANCGVLSCKLVGFDNKLQPNSGDFPFGVALFNWLFNLEMFGIKEPNFHRNEVEFYQSPHEVDWVSGGCMMIKQAVTQKIGFLSSDFFMYFEDVEFCFRAKQAGFRVMLNPEITCHHLSGGSLDSPQYRQWSGELMNMIKFYRKFFGQGSAIMLRSLIYVAVTLRIFAYLVLGKINIANTYAKVIVTI